MRTKAGDLNKQSQIMGQDEPWSTRIQNKMILSNSEQGLLGLNETEHKKWTQWDFKGTSLSSSDLLIFLKEKRCDSMKFCHFSHHFFGTIMLLFAGWFYPPKMTNCSELKIAWVLPNRSPVLWAAAKQRQKFTPQKQTTFKNIFHATVTEILNKVIYFPYSCHSKGNQLCLSVLSLSLSFAPFSLTLTPKETVLFWTKTQASVYVCVCACVRACMCAHVYVGRWFLRKCVYINTVHYDVGCF